ncbi:MAG: hemolysin family protein [Alphaproteobacteria bacterium]
MNGDNGQGGGLASLWRRLIRRSGEPDLKTTLAELVEQQDSGDAPTISPAERQIIENALSLSELTVADVMAPRADIDAVDVAVGVQGAVQKARETYHSRLPVYRGDLDDVIGMVHVKDLLVALTNPEPPAELAPLLRDVLFVVPSMRAIELLLQMQVSRTHMALVVDEYGGIDGLVTVEDVVEEIVGEMRDEHDPEAAPELVDQPDGTIIADARAFVEDFEDRVGFILTEEEREEIDTVGGLVVSLLGRVPTRGEIIVHRSGIEFEVLAGDPRRVHRLRIRNLPSEAASTAEAAVQPDKRAAK